MTRNGRISLSLCVFLGVATEAHSTTLPTEEQVQGALAACSVPRSREVEANLVGAINLWRNEKLSGRANIRFTSILDDFKDENIKLKAYEMYLSCLRKIMEGSSGQDKKNDLLASYALILREINKSIQMKDTLLFSAMKDYETDPTLLAPC